MSKRPMSSPSPSAKKSLFQSPGGFGSPGSSPSSSPVQKRNLTGYLILTGETRVPDTNNNYFDVVVRTGDKKEEIVRIMEMGLQNKEFFCVNVGSVIRLINLSPGRGNNGSLLLYNERYTGSKSLVNQTLNFSNTVTLKMVGELSEQTKGEFHTKGYLFWLGPVTVAANGQDIREAVFTDTDGGQIGITIWNITLINSLAEGIWYNFHDMVVKVFGRLKMNTTKTTVIGKCSEVIDMEVNIPKLLDFMDELEVVEIERIKSIQMWSSKFCSKRGCDHQFQQGEIEENQDSIRCGGCRSKVWVIDLLEKREGTCEIVVKNTTVLKTFTFAVSVFETYMSTTVPNEALEAFEDTCLRLTNITMKCVKQEILAVEDTEVEEEGENEGE